MNVVKRLHSQTVARDEQFSFALVPDRKREVADDLPEAPLPPPLIRAEQELDLAEAPIVVSGGRGLRAAAAGTLLRGS